MSEPQAKHSIYRPEVMAWCGYDVANSGYTTLLITVFVVYLQHEVFPPENFGDRGAVVWAWAIAGSMLAGALLSPLAGAIADRYGGKRIGLAITTFTGGMACLAISLLPLGWHWSVVGCLVIANLSLELSLTFYNGFLPEIASEKEINRVSAAGMGWGYLGGGILLLLAILLLFFGGQSDRSDSDFLLRWCVAAAGVWWIGFTIPALVILKDRSQKSREVPARKWSSLRQTWQLVGEIARQRSVWLFLLAFLLFNDGVQTVISQSPTFALKELAFADTELLAVILMVQVMAMPGALLIGWMAERWGSKPTLMACLVAWVIVLTMAWFVTTKLGFWGMAAAIAMVLGGTQSVARAMMGAMIPAGKEASYFGFFNLSGKATSFLGTFLFGLIVALSGSARLAIVMLFVFFIAGLALLLPVEIKAEQESNQRR